MCCKRKPSGCSGTAPCQRHPQQIYRPRSRASRMRQIVRRSRSAGRIERHPSVAGRISANVALDQHIFKTGPHVSGRVACDGMHRAAHSADQMPVGANSLPQKRVQTNWRPLFIVDAGGWRMQAYVRGPGSLRCGVLELRDITSLIHRMCGFPLYSIHKPEHRER